MYRVKTWNRLKLALEERNRQTRDPSLATTANFLPLSHIVTPFNLEARKCHLMLTLSCDVCVSVVIIFSHLGSQQM